MSRDIVFIGHKRELHEELCGLLEKRGFSLRFYSDVSAEQILDIMKLRPEMVVINSPYTDLVFISALRDHMMSKGFEIKLYDIFTGEYKMTEAEIRALGIDFSTPMPYIPKNVAEHMLRFCCRRDMNEEEFTGLVRELVTRTVRGMGMDLKLTGTVNVIDIVSCDIVHGSREDSCAANYCLSDPARISRTVNYAIKDLIINTDGSLLREFGKMPTYREFTDLVKREVIRENYELIFGHMAERAGR